jgi:hypothetical protein
MTKRFTPLPWIVGLIGMALPCHGLDWEPVPSPAPPSGAASVTWADSEAALPRPISWELVAPEEVIPVVTAVDASPAQQPPAAAPSPTAKQPIPFVTGGLYQVKRGNTWLPSISQVVPTGYGASFGTAQMGLWLESCNTVGGTVCGTNDFKTEFNSNGKGIWTIFAGLGDPTKLIGLDLGFQITSLATTRPDQSSAGTTFGSGQGLDVAISRNLSENVAIKLGAKNLIEFDEVQLDQGRSAYGVISSRFDLGGPKDENSHDLYTTIGLANGRYRPLNVIYDDQTAECAKDVAKNGSRTPFKYGDLCNVWGLDYGDPYPVASIAYLVNPQLSLIAEWWGRNLSLAASIKPFEGINWVITPGITSLIKNADWDPKYPGYTETVRFQLTTSIGF